MKFEPVRSFVRLIKSLEIGGSVSVYLGLFDLPSDANAKYHTLYLGLWGDSQDLKRLNEHWISLNEFGSGRCVRRYTQRHTPVRPSSRQSQTPRDSTLFPVALSAAAQYLSPAGLKSYTLCKTRRKCWG